MRKLLLILCLMALPAYADDIPANVTKVSDIAYGTNKLEKLDVYTPTRCKQGGCPVVIWVHGGGWRMGDKSYTGAPRLASSWCPLGAVLVAVNYRLSPDDMHPAHVQDIAGSIAWVKQNIQSYGGNSNKVYLLGHSAGAHLVALVATDPQYLAKYNLTPAGALAGVFPIDSASYDLNSSSSEPWVGRMVKQAFGSNPAQLSAASPIDLVANNRDVKYPLFIMAATKNRPTAVFQMNKLIQELQRAGGNAQGMIVDYPGARQLQAHGDIAKDLSNTSHAMTKRLMAEIGLQP